jgi:hypothetical protein
MQALTLDEKIIALTDLISINTDPRRIADLEDQRAHLLILRYPAYRDRNIGNKPTLKAKPEFVEEDMGELMNTALQSGNIFGLVEHMGFTHIFYIGDTQAVIIKAMVNSRGWYYNANQETREDARERYSQLLDQGCKKVADIAEIAAKAAKEYLK